MFRIVARNFGKAQRGILRPKYDLKIGQCVNGFRLEHSEYIPVYDMTGYILRHQKTKARYIHIDSSNTDNAFAVLFRTPPENNYGTCHILEHMALCGSSRFPVHDPFFKMIKRSLNTYMNAWTGNDFTMYPFSTENERDFQNLLKVYLDAVFFPFLNHQDFLQEAHRYEFTEDNTKLQQTGVVFNEMKGVLSDPQELFSTRLLQNLFRKAPYKYNFGGDPSEIPKLSYSSLVNYHQKYYHPSNSCFMSFGDLDFTKHLEVIKTWIMPKFDNYKKINSEIILEPRIEGHMRRIEERFIPDAIRPVENQAKIAISTLCNESFESPYESFKLKILSKMMIEGTSSPMYKALIESQLGDSFCPSIGYDTQTRDSIFTIGLQGCQEEEKWLDEIENAIQDTLQNLAKTGFDLATVKKSLHELLFESRKTSENYGLSLLCEISQPVLYDKNPFVVFKNTELAKTLMEEYNSTNGDVFKELIKKYLLQESQNKIRLVMKADPELPVELSLKETDFLETKFKKLTEQEISNIRKQSIILNKSQNQVEDIEILPKIELSDIPVIKDYPKFETKILPNNVPVSYFSQPTNGITHIRIKYNIDGLDEMQKINLPIFVELLPFIGTKVHKYFEFEKEFFTYTGGLSLQLDPFNVSPSAFDQHRECLFIHFAFLDENREKAFALVSELLSQGDFQDSKLLSDIMRMKYVEKSNNFTAEALNYAMSYAASGLKSLSKRFELLKSDIFICRVAEALSPETPKVLEDLKSINESILHSLPKCPIEVCVHGQKDFDEIQNLLSNLFSTMGKTENTEIIKDFKKAFTQNPKKTIIKIPQTVNYCVETYDIPSLYHKDYPKFLVLSEILTHAFLHREIREKGGAYGGGCRVSPNGLFLFFSYRDPRLLETFVEYSIALEKVKNGLFSKEDLRDAKVVAFQKIDRAKDPADNGLIFFNRKVDPELLNMMRNVILECTPAEIVEIAKKYFEEAKASKCVFGTNDLENETELTEKGWKIVDIKTLMGI